MSKPRVFKHRGTNLWCALISGDEHFATTWLESFTLALGCAELDNLLGLPASHLPIPPSP